VSAPSRYRSRRSEGSIAPPLAPSPHPGGEGALRSRAGAGTRLTTATCVAVATRDACPGGRPEGPRSLEGAGQREGARAGATAGLRPLPALLLACLLAAPAPWPARAAEPAAALALAIPVDCAIGTDCFVQNYFDHDPGPGRMDWACGRLSYDGHDGTDFRVPDLPAMERGVAVLAAADGVVRATRDGMPDVNVNVPGRDRLGGRDAGNAVVLDHGDGWVSQYSHLRRGSVAVREGQRVRAGERLGDIGLSGNTEFPHVELAVRYRGRAVDPFVGLAPFADCGDRRAPLWRGEARRLLAYRPTGPLAAGFATGPVDPGAARRGDLDARTFSPGTPALVMWVDLFGAMEGDIERFRILGPDGAALHDRRRRLERSNVSWFAWSGRRRPPPGWARGRYRGVYTLTRGAETVLEMTAEAEIR